MIKKFKRATAVSVAAAALVAGSVLVSVTPANAVVWNCVTGYSSVGVYGKCGSGDTSLYYVNVLCQNWFTRSSRVVSGNVVSIYSSTPSTVQGCGAFESFYGTPWVSSV